MQRSLIAFLLFALAPGAPAQTASLLVYRVWETGLPPYVSRVLVTPEYVRLDEDAEGEAGYTLFDRQREVIYNVMPPDRSVLVMNPRLPLPEPDDSLILEEVVETDQAAPTVAGRQPREVRLLANGEVCSDLVVIDGVMEDAVEALAEMRRVLARVQAQRLASVPLGFDSACELASTVYAADRSLRFGLPLQERSTGRSQSLVDFDEDFAADPSLFTLPQDYRRQSMFTTNAI